METTIQHKVQEIDSLNKKLSDALSQVDHKSGEISLMLKDNQAKVDEKVAQYSTILT